MNTIIQILQSHNLIWTREQLLIALAVIVVAAVLLAIPLRRRQIGLGEFFAGLGIVIYAVIILGGTVFFRPMIGAAYQLDPLVEYRAIAGGLAAGDSYVVRLYAIEIVINLLMLAPVGLLLPWALGRKVAWWQGLALGAAVSLVVEVLQFATDVGLFQTADVIHNALGCMVGCVVGSAEVKSFKERTEK